MTANTYTLLAPDRQPYQSATSGALGGYRPGRVCGRLSDSKWSRSTPPSSGLRTGYELGQVFGHYGGKASGRPERNVAGAAGATGPLKILSAAP